MNHHTCQLLQQSLVPYWAELRTTKMRVICSQAESPCAVRPVTKQNRKFGRQPAVSHSVRLFFSPRALPGEKKRRVVCDIHILDCVPPSNHAEPTRQRRAQGLWPWRAGKRDISPELAANPTLSCWHRTFVYHLCLSCKLLTASSRALRVYLIVI